MLTTHFYPFKIKTTLFKKVGRPRRGWGRPFVNSEWPSGPRCHGSGGHGDETQFMYVRSERKKGLFGELKPSVQDEPNLPTELLYPLLGLFEVPPENFGRCGHQSLGLDCLVIHFFPEQPMGALQGFYFPRLNCWHETSIFLFINRQKAGFLY